MFKNSILAILKKKKRNYFSCKNNYLSILIPKHIKQYNCEIDSLS